MNQFDENIAMVRAQIERGDLQGAHWQLQKLIKREPSNPALIGLAALFEFRTGNHARAIEMLRHSVRALPTSAQLHEDLGLALEACNQRPAALDQFREAIRLDPNRLAALEHAAELLAEIESWEESEKYLRQLTSIRPDLSESWNKLGLALVVTGRLDEADELFNRAQSLAPSAAHIGNNRVFLANYRDDQSPEKVLAIHRAWNEQFGSSTENSFVDVDRTPDRRLRIGYVSADFRGHAVNSFFEPILTNHDRQRFEIFCYSNSKFIDHVTERLRAKAFAWRDIFDRNDADAFRMIREDRIDILIDLSGHTSGNRLTLFAMSPSPVQFTYLGYPNTTGVPAIQYRLTDAVADPPGITDAHHSEALARLPDCFLCYQPDASVPPPLDATPARQTGHVTFGSFNGFVKVTDRMMNLWAKILHAVPNSRLLIKSRALDVPIVQQRIRDLFRASEIPDDRFTMMSWLPSAQRHSIVASADIALDTFPYHGTTTTCETLWMGVPWITLAGRSHVSRVGASILTAIGCPELIVNSAEDYVAKAIALANDLPTLDEYRRRLRQGMETSPLMDAPRFARNLESVYRTAWRKWTSESPADR